MLFPKHASVQGAGVTRWMGFTALFSFVGRNFSVLYAGYLSSLLSESLDHGPYLFHRFKLFVVVLVHGCFSWLQKNLANQSFGGVA